MDKPEQTVKDFAHKLTKGAIGAIPFAGAFIGELMEIVIQPQYQKKLNEWFDYVDFTIKEVVEKQIKTKQEIFSDEDFISMFQRTSRAYINNVERNKIPILQTLLKSHIIKEI